MTRTRHVRPLIVVGALSLATFGPSAGPAAAAHNSNNRAELTGTADPDATGLAIVNHSAGLNDFNGTVIVSNLTQGETYAFYLSRVRLGVLSETLVCTGTADGQGTFTCAAQHLTSGGFTTAVVKDSAGVVVASGIFERRGTCRDPEQMNHNCDAPGQNP